MNEQRDERYIGCGCGFDEENSVLDEGAEKSYQMFRALILKSMYIASTRMCGTCKGADRYDQELVS